MALQRFDIANERLALELSRANVEAQLQKVENQRAVLTDQLAAIDLQLEELARLDDTSAAQQRMPQSMYTAIHADSRAVRNQRHIEQQALVDRIARNQRRLEQQALDDRVVRNQRRLEQQALDDPICRNQRRLEQQPFDNQRRLQRQALDDWIVRNQRHPEQQALDDRTIRNQRRLEQQTLDDRVVADAKERAARGILEFARQQLGGRSFGDDRLTQPRKAGSDSKADFFNSVSIEACVSDEGGAAPSFADAGTVIAEEVEDDAHQVALSRRTNALRLDEAPPLIDCAVCTASFLPSQTVTLRCDHTWCRGCMSQRYQEATVNEGAWPVKCCRTEISVESVSHLLSLDQRTRFAIKATEWADTNLVVAVPSSATNAPESGSNVDVPNGARSPCLNEPTKLQGVKVEPMLGVWQEKSSADTTAITGYGPNTREAARAISADKP